VSPAIIPRSARVTLIVGLVGVVSVVVLSVAGPSTGAGATSTAGDRRIARAGVLRLDDFPAGWKQSPRVSTTDKERDAAAAKIASCRPFLAFSTATRRNPRAQSPNFDLQQSNVINTVSVFPSTAAATAAMRKFARPGVPACLDRLYRSVFEIRLAKEPKVANKLVSVKVAMKRLAGIEIGDEVVAYDGRAAVGLKDGTVQTIGLGAVTVRVGNALASYLYSADADISTALQPAIVASVSRLLAAVAPPAH
jgi:hypothetical protein